MSVKNNAMSAQLEALKKTDLSPLIRMSGLVMPKMIDGFLQTLDVKQRSAFDKVMPRGGEKRIYLHLVSTPTPPIVVRMAQPINMNIIPEHELRQQQIKGIRLTIEDLRLLTERRILRLFWRLKGQFGTFLSLAGMFVPFVLLGPGGLRDLQNKAKIHFKPLTDLMPRPIR